MPVYDYECPACQHKFEVMRKFSETGGGACPRCGAEGRRVYSAPFLVFKGPGFYVTDSRTEKDPEVEHAKKEKETAEKAVKEAETKKTEADSGKSKPDAMAEGSGHAASDANPS
jgi:putative FmdB family regulatory protein